MLKFIQELKEKFSIRDVEIASYKEYYKLELIPDVIVTVITFFAKRGSGGGFWPGAGSTITVRGLEYSQAFRTSQPNVEAFSHDQRRQKLGWQQPNNLEVLIMAEYF